MFFISSLPPSSTEALTASVARVEYGSKKITTDYSQPPNSAGISQPSQYGISLERRSAGADGGRMLREAKKQINPTARDNSVYVTCMKALGVGKTRTSRWESGKVHLFAGRKQRRWGYKFHSSCYLSWTEVDEMSSCWTLRKLSGAPSLWRELQTGKVGGGRWEYIF